MNAQSSAKQSDPGGVAPKAVERLVGATSYTLICVEEGDSTGLLMVNFAVAGGNNNANPLSEPRIFMHKPDGTTEIIDRFDPRFHTAPPIPPNTNPLYLSFWFLGKLCIGTTTFTAEVIQTPPGGLLVSNPVNINVLPTPEVKLIQPIGVLCEGNDLVLTTKVFWDTEIFPLTAVIDYEWNWDGIPQGETELFPNPGPFPNPPLYKDTTISNLNVGAHHFKFGLNIFDVVDG
ncbi:MAG: hypothetical protein FWF70_05220, partial [Bacteroidetes bacterium]|nr:hypothetical protein [Bacteroidota bacterium]